MASDDPKQEALNNFLRNAKELNDSDLIDLALQKGAKEKPGSYPNIVRSVMDNRQIVLDRFFCDLCLSEDYDLIKEIVLLGANVNAFGGAALDWAVNTNREHLVRVLYDLGAREVTHSMTKFMNDFIEEANKKANFKIE